MSYSGYDIEDAIIMNKASLDRGFGRCVVLRKYGTVLKKHQNRSADLLEPPKIPAGQVRAPAEKLRPLLVKTSLHRAARLPGP